MCVPRARKCSASGARNSGAQIFATHVEPLQVRHKESHKEVRSLRDQHAEELVASEAEWKGRLELQTDAVLAKHDAVQSALEQATSAMLQVKAVEAQLAQERRRVAVLEDDNERLERNASAQAQQQW